MNEVKTIRLYGKLGATFGRVHRFAVSSPAEAVQALCSQKPGFERFLTEAKQNGLEFAVFIGRRNLREENLLDPPGMEDIRIAPVSTGSKRGGILQTIVGAALIVVGVMAWFAPGVNAALISAGIGMVAGGVIQMLTPMPKSGSRDDPDANASYAFNGPINTQAQGNPVPLLYGRMLVGSAVISASIVANQQQIAGGWRDGPTNGGGSLSDRLAYVESVYGN